MTSEKRWRIDLKTIEPLRVGAVKDPRSRIEKPVTKVGDRVVIPGPSLKGALRAEIEQFLIDTHYGKASPDWPKDKLAFQPCIPSDERLITSDERLLIKEGKFRPQGACHYPCKREEPAPHSICPACYFLGAMGLPGFVRVPFLYAEISPEELYSSRIDRAVNTVVERTNRPYQLVRSGAEFSGELVIIIEDPVAGWKIGEPRPLKDKTLGDDWLKQQSLKAEDLINTYVIERLRAINILGGYKSKGFGQVKIEVTPL